MRSRIEASITAMPAALVLAAVLVVAASGTAVAQPAGGPDETEIARALETVKQDPNLATERTIKMLQWRGSNQQTKPPGWWRWVVDLFRWFDQSARFLIWVAGAVLVGFLLFYLVRLTAAGRNTVFDAASFVAPSHVRDLDIRPESLPADIGAAARALWDRGERRPALALLYRGMLSRFAHVHQIPVRDSSTEGDCLVLAATHLSAPRAKYASLLVREWQRVVYGRESAETVTIHGLCDAFAPALDHRAPSGSMETPS